MQVTRKTHIPRGSGNGENVISREEMEQAHQLKKQVWLSLKIGDRRPDIWDKARASGMDGICTDWPLECRLHWRNTP